MRRQEDPNDRVRSLCHSEKLTAQVVISERQASCGSVYVFSQRLAGLGTFVVADSCAARGQADETEAENRD